MQAHAVQDRVFREVLLVEALNCCLAGDTDTGKAILRDAITATIGFEDLGALTGKEVKSLMRMFGKTRRNAKRA